MGGAGRESSEKIKMSSVIAWLVRSGVGATAGASITIALMGLGSIFGDVVMQRQRLSAHEETQQADMKRIDEKNAAQDEQLAEHGETLANVPRIDEKNAVQDEQLAEHGETLANVPRIDEKNAVQDEQLAEHGKTLANVPRIDEKNAEQDEKLAKLGETQVKILTILEQNGKALRRLENKVDTLLMRDSKDSASSDLAHFLDLRMAEGRPSSNLAIFS